MELRNFGFVGVLVTASILSTTSTRACEECGMPADVSTAPTNGSRWGGTGHQLINGYAVDNLPEEMFDDGSGNAFNDWRDFLVSHASDPDFLRTSGIDDLEAERHYCDIDNNIAQYPAPFSTVPRDYDEFDATFGRDTGVVMWEGIADHADALRIALKTRNWAASRQVAADLGHYVGDAHSPFHGTVNYNGQFTGQNGIHSRHESSLVSRYFDSILEGLRTRRTDPPLGGAAELVPDAVELGFTIIAESQADTLTILAADLESRAIDPSYGDNYYEEMYARVGALTVNRFNLACQRLSDVWYTAWVEAGSPGFSTMPQPRPALASVPVVDGNLNDMQGITELQTTTTDQSNATDFDDNENELDQLFLNHSEGHLHLGLAGNMTAGHAIIILLDTRTGGSSTLSARGPAFLSALSGTTLASGFQPDFALTLDHATTWNVQITDLVTGTVTLLGSGTGEGFTLAPSGAFAFDNSNTDGVRHRDGRTVGDCENVRTGVELTIPQDLLGLGFEDTDVKLLCALTRNTASGFVSNQFLPGMPLGDVNPGTTASQNWSARMWAHYRIGTASMFVVR